MSDCRFPCNSLSIVTVSSATATDIRSCCIRHLCGGGIESSYWHFHVYLVHVQRYPGVIFAYTHGKSRFVRRSVCIVGKSFVSISFFPPSGLSGRLCGTVQYTTAKAKDTATLGWPSVSLSKPQRMELERNTKREALVKAMENKVCASQQRRRRSSGFYQF
jgi:hypothetical protein